MTASYQPLLVLLSVLIAILASYTALGLGSRVIRAERSAVKYWMLGGSLTMAIGIWAMHFVGMLAFHLPIPLAYDVGITLISILPALVASAIALYALRRQHRSSWTFYTASVLMGGGIAGMHYTGMAALRMYPAVQYDPALFTLSILIAVIASAVALRLVFRFENGQLKRAAWHKGLASLVMGIAIAGMHYTGMAAARFKPGSICLAVDDGIGGPVLTALVSAGAILIMLTALAAIVVDRLRGQNAFYSTLISAQSDVGEGILMLEEGRVIFANQAMCGITGRTLDSLTDLDALRSLLAPTDFSRLERTLVEVENNGQRRHLELCFDSGADEPRDCEATIAAFRYQDRWRTVMLCLDITERKRADQMQRASEEKLRALFVHSPLGMSLATVKGRLVEANPSLCDLVGYRADEIIKLDFTDLISHHNRREHNQLFEDLAAHGRFGPLELKFQHRDGALVPVSLNGVLITGSDNEKYIWATTEDISERVRADETLRQLKDTLEKRVVERTGELEASRGFIEGVLDTAGALIVLLDRAGRIVRFNRACEQLTGYRFVDIENELFWEALYSPEEQTTVSGIFQRLINEDEPARYENEWLTATGERRLITWSNAVLRSDTGQAQFVIATGIDITERKQAERAVMQANRSLQDTINDLTDTQQKLVQAEKMASLGSLVAGISHEINTPLGIGVTAASNLDEELDKLERDFIAGNMKRSGFETFVEHARHANDILLTNLRRASELIASFKQVAVDQSSDAWRTVDLREYVDEIILSLRPKWKHTRISLVNDTEPGLDIYTHPGAIYQVLSNLILNSLTHAFGEGDKGTIRISASRQGDLLRILYEDDGAGIADEHREQIFDPFFTTRRGKGGSGLGLHIVYNQVATTLNGTIEFNHPQGRGVRFVINIPWKHTETQA